MPATNTRAVRRSSYRSSDAIDVIRRVLIKFVIFVLIIAVMIGIGVYVAKKKTPSAVATMTSQPLPMKVADLTSEQVVELIQLYDPDFYTHNGYSSKSTGFRSITQRLVEQYYFTGYQAWLEMAPGTIDAWALNQAMPKEEQLKVFINTVPFGTSHDHPVNGFKEAAAAFFQKDFRELNRDEYLSILAMLADPDKYHIQAEALANIERTNRIKKMLDGKCKPASIMDVELKNCR